MAAVEVTETWWWWVHVAATWALVGLIWMVQRVVYPSMVRQSPDGWKVWHADYTARMGTVVGPLMLIELAGAAGWCWQAPTSGWAWLAGVVVGVNWLSTAVIQLPLHRKLAGGFDESLIRRLVLTNWIRTVAWSLRGVVVFFVASR